MQFHTVCRTLVVGGTLLIWLIKFFLRPCLHPTGTTGFLLGIAPNLFGAFLLPFGAYWLCTFPALFKGRLFRLAVFLEVRTVCPAGFGLLVINEYLQQVPLFGRTFDYFDMLASAIGLLLSAYCFPALQRRQGLASG